MRVTVNQTDRHRSYELELARAELPLSLLADLAAAGATPDGAPREVA